MDIVAFCWAAIAAYEKMAADAPEAPRTMLCIDWTPCWPDRDGKAVAACPKIGCVCWPWG